MKVGKKQKHTHTQNFDHLNIVESNEINLMEISF